MSAALVLLLPSATNAMAGTPEKPGDCSAMERWLPNSEYPVGSCVYYGKYIWANDVHAESGQRPGNDDRRWYKIGDNTLDDLNVVVAANAAAQPTVFTYTAEAPWRDTRVQFVAKGTQRRQVVAFPQDGYTSLKVLASVEGNGNGGRVFPLWLRAQRNVTGSGQGGDLGPLEASGGHVGRGTLVVWYDPADNPGLKSGARYRTKPGTRLVIDAMGTDLPKQPKIGTFRLGVDIVHQANQPTQPSQQ
ncbi:hypothetical protein [Cupriavidus sp. D384]|uniref:hypothetical protein n=1 Tax=Cupriavidus sp. D384 TaxID=1538095 RepID=UPI0008360FBC|nr:hypothetical protein [Cupriavidus sp. D384]